MGGVASTAGSGAAALAPPAPSAPAPPPPALPLLGGGYAVLETLAAGALAGLVAETLMHPLDTVSHRAKVHPRGDYGSLLGAARLLAREEGARGLFAGLRATLAQGPPSTAVYFLTYEAAKAAGLRATEGRHADAVFFASGAASELFASVVFVPLEVVKSRMQLGANPSRATGGVVASTTNFRTVREALAGIYAERGWAGLTAGWQAGFVQDVAFAVRAKAAYPDAVIFTLREAVVALRPMSFGLVAEVKQLFPGAEVTAIRPRTKIEQDLDDEIIW